MEDEEKYWCYRFKKEPRTHFGPLKLSSVPKLLERLIVLFGKSRLDEGIEFWRTSKDDYLWPPKPDSGVTIYEYDQSGGWRPKGST